MGVDLPRNSREQAKSDLLVPVERENLQPGDLLFFALANNKIHHVGMYLGEEEFIHAGVRDGSPSLMISNLKTTNYNFSTARRPKAFVK